MYSEIRLVSGKFLLFIELNLTERRPGNESVAVVEFAPCQKTPPEKKKVDPRIGTIVNGSFHHKVY